jgi:hypothetical protein
MNHAGSPYTVEKLARLREEQMQDDWKRRRPGATSGRPRRWRVRHGIAGALRSAARRIDSLPAPAGR